MSTTLTQDLELIAEHIGDDQPNLPEGAKNTILLAAKALANQQESTIRWQRVASFWVPGEPQAQPRAKAMTIGGKTRIYTPDPKRADGSKPVSAWRQSVSLHAAPYAPREPFDCPVKVDTLFYFSRPKSHYRTGKYANDIKPNAPLFHTAKPDKDNAEKLILDAMTKGGWFVDDSRVVTGTPTKLYHGQDGTPGAMIQVSVIDAAQEQQLFERGAA